MDENNYMRYIHVSNMALVLVSAIAEDIGVLFKLRANKHLIVGNN